MAKLKDLIKENAVLGGVVSRNAFSGIDMGFRTQHPNGNQGKSLGMDKNL